ncbi:PAS domain-containing protein [Aquariibacter albus]|uniref:Sensor histidine kinase n=1 Tax=Aquariibacter albus TaxID=2759899 RepID=A0A839HKI3_9BURK|nr:PAS domain-containing protein [Aquariibacter albus]MBB1163347.1 sensor histidine kinase [Aquariibacter albus]
MQRSLHTLFETLSDGFLWIGRDLRIRYANQKAELRLGLRTGTALPDGPLLKAVLRTLGGQTSPNVPWPNRSEPEAPFDCRVMGGLSKDDCMVFIGGRAAQGQDTGFDNFLMAVRDDLQQPLAQFADTVRRIPRTQRSPLSEELVATAETLAETLARLLDLGSLWERESLVSTDRVELWPLLEEAWRELQPLAERRHVRVRFSGFGDPQRLAPVYGSAFWLRRVLLECLLATVRRAPADSFVDVEHTQMGPRMVIMLRDCGAMAGERPDRVELARPEAPASAPTRAPAREILGIRLCQRIVALHGGHLREEHDAGVHNLLIDLPTGAPARDTETALNAAQLERYVQDLTALLRERKEHPAER